MKNNKILPSLLLYTYKIEIDLIGDLNKIVNKRLEGMGYKPVNGNYSTIDYFKALRKLIPAKPRNILYSKEFICPHECEDGLNLLENAIKSGDNLVPFMSKQITNPKHNDLLLNDWGIYHFHLNTKKEENGFIKRSAWLLLAYIDDNYAYLINVYPHNKPNLWTHQKMVEILHNNWSDLLEKFHLKEVSGLSEKIDDEKYAQLRKAGASTFVELGKDKVFGMIGGGYATDGSSITAVRESDYWHNYLREVEFFIKENYYSFKQQMTYFDEQSLDKPLKIQMLNLTEDELILLEKLRMVLIKFNHKNGDIRMCRLQDIIYDTSYKYRNYKLFVTNLCTYDNSK
ncbi:MAG: hypothetical protein QME46_11095 [Thermoanaerobacteraceae bacterium]|nr:hypothetical protein [Thermoanaerobacteraceae bacterium]